MLPLSDHTLLIVMAACLLVTAWMGYEVIGELKAILRELKAILEKLTTIGDREKGEERPEEWRVMDESRRQRAEAERVGREVEAEIEAERIRRERAKRKAAQKKASS